MLRLQRKLNIERRVSVIFLMMLVTLLGVGAGGCKKKAAPPPKPVRRYHLMGKVISVEKGKDTLIIDGQKIPGFMDAMIMPYPVHKVRYIEGVKPGDEISAEIVINPDATYYLENVVVTKKASTAPAKSKTERHPPQPAH